MEEKQNYFEELLSINMNEFKEEKNKLDYISWAYAWAQVKRLHPTMNSKVYETPDGCIYWTDGRTCWVKVGVTVNDVEHIEYLPVMDYNNRSIPLERVDSMAVNKAIQRAMTKAIARHGLGLYVYAGEDLPDDLLKDNDTEIKSPAPEQKKTAEPKKTADFVYELREDASEELKSRYNRFVNELHGVLKVLLTSKKVKDVNDLPIAEWDKAIAIQEKWVEVKKKEQGAR